MGCLILVLLLFVASSSSAIREFMVHPSNGTGACSQTAQLCLPLTHYLNDSAMFNFTAVRLVFLPGIHTLPEREDHGVYAIRNVQELAFLGQSRAVISCSGSTGLAFVNITGLNLDNITIENCGVGLTEAFLGGSTNLFDNDLNLLGHNITMKAALFMSLVSNLTLSGVIVTNNTGYGMVAVNLIGNTMITNVQFTNNNLQALQDTLCTTTLSRHCKGGNLVFIFTDTESVCPDMPTTHTVLVRESVFRIGVDLTPAFQPFIFLRGEIPPFYGGGGIGLTLAQSTYGVNFIMDNTTLAENIAYTGSNLYITVFEQVNNFSMIITNCRINYGNSMIESGDVRLTGLFVLATGFSLAYGIKPPLSFVPICIADDQNFQFKIENSEFIKNNANLVCAALLYLWGESSTVNTREITFQNAVFQGNKGDSTIAIFEISNFVDVLPFRILMTNLTFTSNEVSERTGFARTFQQEIVVINSLRYIQFSGCLFQDNKGSPLRITESTIFMNGVNQFIGNTAAIGSGLLLEEGSTVYFEPRSVTLFRDNKAETFGGAIYAVITSYKCFYQILSPDPDDFPRLIFQNNSAASAGDAVYGNVDNCLLEQFTSVVDSDIVFSEISTFLEHSNKDSLITSTGHRLCLCSNGSSSVPNCNDLLSLSLDTFPGQQFRITVAVRGYDGNFGVGYTPASLHTDFVQNITAIELGSNQLTQDLGHGCSSLFFNFYALPQTVTINLLATIGRVFNTFPIHVNLMPCPPGFQISNKTTQTQCVCNDLIQDRQLTCDINTLKVSRNQDLWVGVTNQTGIPEVTIGGCPIAYCSQTRIPVSIDNADEQCFYNRSGLLCGMCSDGLSVAIGSSRCFECSNVYLLLLVVFTIFGILLILLLIVANLTVATGMINGLLFYANVVKVTNLQNNSPETYFLLPFSIFINWLNLDFGIETCFYDGFDEYTKTWLQYIFPFYLFFLMGVAILVSSKSAKLSRILPRNIVAVFATVLLISYTKLLRAAIVPFPFSRLYTSLNTFSVVWIYDGNLVYFGPKHAPLVIFSISVALLLIFPYVFLLTTYHFLQKLNGKEDSKAEACFTWIRLKLFRLKPIFDAYDAPLKGGQRYWTGLLLILRTFIFFTVAVSLATRSPLVLNSAVVIVMSIILLGMILTVGVYNQKKIRALECIHYVNLASLEFINLILDLVGHSDRDAKAIALSVSIAVAFMLFLYAIVYQIYLKLQDRLPGLEKFEIKMKMMYDNNTIAASNVTAIQSHVDTVIDEIDRRTSYTLGTENNNVTQTTVSIND